MIPTGYRMLYHLSRVGLGVWVSIEEIYAAFPRSQIRRASRDAMALGYIEEAAQVLTQNRNPGWFSDLAREHGHELNGFDAWKWLGAVRITARGARQLCAAWANGWRPPGFGVGDHDPTIPQPTRLPAAPAQQDFKGEE